jgi:transcriptional regulator with XRE-family HTH domain
MPRSMAKLPIGKKIKQARLERGLSVSELAKRAGVNRGSLYRIENGAVPHASTLRKLSRVLEKTRKLPDFLT